MSSPDAVFEPKGLVPTAEQRAIQLVRKPPLIIEANAGAAKTTTLALRLAQALLRTALLQEDVERTVTLACVVAAIIKWPVQNKEAAGL